jgi:3-hydroxyisobutyrate dehydrogenase
VRVVDEHMPEQVTGTQGLWFIGLGRMGWPMCLRLAAAYDVLAVDVDRSAVRRAREGGVSAVERVGRSDPAPRAVLSMLPAGEATVAAAAAAMPFLPAGTTWIDMGSNTPQTGESLHQMAAERGVEVLEAPVGGGPEDAARGSLLLFVGGDEPLLRGHRDLLVTLAGPDRIHYVGGPGHGYLAKLLVNVMWFAQVVSTAEALLVGRAAGLDPARMHAAMRDSAVAGRFVEHDVTALLTGDYLTSFGLAGCVEELQAVQALAHQFGTPFTAGDVVTRVHEDALRSFGPVDGELLGAAELERVAALSLNVRRIDAG